MAPFRLRAFLTLLAFTVAVSAAPEERVGQIRRQIASAAETKPSAETAQPAATDPMIEEFSRALEQAQKAYAALNGYTATLSKQERIEGKLLPREVGLFKFRKPFSVYVKWAEGPNAGTQVLYVRGQNDGKLLARKGGLLGIKTFYLDPHGKLAMENNRHPITEAGLGHLLNILETNRKKAIAEGKARVRRLPDDPKVKPAGPRYELLLDAREGSGYYAPRALVTFDPKTALIGAVQIYDWKGQLIEDYRYYDLRPDPGLTDRDFDPNNPDYNF